MPNSASGGKANSEHLALWPLAATPVGSSNADGAVVVDVERRTGLLFDLADHLALGPDDLTDLVAAGSAPLRCGA